MTRARVDLVRKLNTFDVTSLVIGSIIGADIYVAAALGARLIGPSSIVVWVAAGVMAVVIALSFAHCATMMPRVGGPYAYVKESMGELPGFMVGWALFLAEWFSLAVFPVAFAQYAVALAPELSGWHVIALKAVFIVTVFATNLVGVKAAGRVNDVLTVAKLGPLILLTASGVLFIMFNLAPAGSNLTPFFTGTGAGVGQSLVLIFWAYAGFELSTLPADEIERPERTIPRAIVTGMLVVMAFYVVTNLVILGVLDQTSLMSSQSPLMEAGSVMFAPIQGLSSAVPVIVGIGALVSILGADESGTIGTSRLSFALSADGLFPRPFSRLHPRFHTPHIGLAIICSTAFVASILGGLTELINASVFLLAFAYLFTCLSVLGLRAKHRDVYSRLRHPGPVAFAGAVFSVGLMALVSLRLAAVSAALLLIGFPVYAFFSPGKELHELRSAFLSRDAVLRRAYEQGERFLAVPWRRLLWLTYRFRKKSRPWRVHMPPERGRRG